MTITVYLKLARDVVIGLALAFLVFRIYTDGKNAVHAQQFKDLQKQVARQTVILDGWRQESINANAQLSKDLAALAAAPVTRHNWVRDIGSCPQAMLPTAPGTPRGAAPGAGGVQPGGGEVDEGLRRDAVLAEFKRTWEATLAACRAEHAQWPMP